MKIKIRHMCYDEVCALTPKPHKKPMKQSFFFRLLLRVASLPALWAVKFKVQKTGMERLRKKEPCLYLMNHSCFLDMEIASSIIFPRRFNVVSTYDSFVGKNWLMRLIGCIPTRKFIPDLTLIRDMQYAVKELNSSVLLYPEAGYSFDGTATVLPDNLGACVKMLGVPVVMIQTFGAFSRQPLYNNLKLRRVPVSAQMRYLLSAEELEQMSAEEINAVIRAQFLFDSFRWQQENRIKIDSPDRAESLERVLYKCPACLAEGKTQGVGTKLICHACGKRYELDEYGFMKAENGVTEFDHIPDWFAWERSCVRRELEDGNYRMECDVEIMMLMDSQCLYSVGNGKLTHDREGFLLISDDGKLEYRQKPLASYTLNADFYWYEIGDVIGIGNQSALYYCFPKEQNIPVAKTRLATEELYKMVKQEKDEKRAARRNKKTDL